MTESICLASSCCLSLALLLRDAACSIASNSVNPSGVSAEMFLQDSSECCFSSMWQEASKSAPLLHPTTQAAPHDQCN